MKALYGKLFESCKEYPGFDKAAHFVSMKGVFYDKNKIKLLLVGWAPNGWESLLTNNEESFGLDAERKYNDCHRFKWIECINNSLYSTHDREMPLNKRYCVSNKHYWIKAKQVWEKLSGTESQHPVWQENIAWTNLYKISPNTGDDPNPDKKLKRMQLEACKEILKKEIDDYAPTHILIFSGVEGWFEDFKTIFENVEDKGLRNISRGNNKNNIYVEATANYKGAKVVVTCRPEWRDTAPFVEQVVTAFK